MSKIAIFGGSFDPPHQGHLDVIKWLAMDCPVDLEEIWVLPTVNHAFAKDLLPYEMREKMVNAMLDEAFPGGSGFFKLSPVKRDRIRVRRHSEQYMAETLEKLRSCGPYPPDKFMLVVGTDIINERDKWHRWEDVTRMADILVVSREGVEAEVPDNWKIHQIKAADPSSTSIRERLANSDLTYLVGKGADVPASVMRIIERDNLYGYKPPEHGDQRVLVENFYVPVKEFLGQGFQPGVAFSLTGDIRKVLSVWTQNHDGAYCFVFQILRDTSVLEENDRAVRHWMELQTAARYGGQEFTDPKPKPHSPPLVYLKAGEPAETTAPGKILGQADGYLFFEFLGGGEGFGGLFGGLFGL